MILKINNITLYGMAIVIGDDKITIKKKRKKKYEWNDKLIAHFSIYQLMSMLDFRFQFIYLSISQWNIVSYAGLFLVGYCC